MKKEGKTHEGDPPMTQEEAAKCRLRLWVLRELRRWGTQSPLHNVFVRGVVRDWRAEYDGKPPKDVVKLRKFVDQGGPLRTLPPEWAAGSSPAPARVSNRSVAP